MATNAMPAAAYLLGQLLQPCGILADDGALDADEGDDGGLLTLHLGQRPSFAAEVLQSEAIDLTAESRRHHRGAGGGGNATEK